MAWKLNINEANTYIGSDIRIPTVKNMQIVIAIQNYLINISGGVVEDPEHGDETVRGAVGTGDVRPGRANVVNI